LILGLDLYLIWEEVLVSEYINLVARDLEEDRGIQTSHRTPQLGSARRLWDYYPSYFSLSCLFYHPYFLGQDQQQQALQCGSMALYRRILCTDLRLDSRLTTISILLRWISTHPTNSRNWTRKRKSVMCNSYGMDVSRS
jgi:hypothetical protein